MGGGCHVEPPLRQVAAHRPVILDRLEDGFGQDDKIVESIKYSLDWDVE